MCDAARASSMRRATSKPVSPGICTSRNTTSGCSRSIVVQRLDAVARLPDDLDAADLPEQIAQLVARELLVVDQHGAQVHAYAVTRSGSISLGNLDAGARARAGDARELQLQLAP